MDSHKAIDPIQFMEALPHGKALGMQLVELGDGTAVLRLPFDTRFVGDPETGVLHGGAISALMDTCCGASVIAHPKVMGMTATIDLRIDYLRSATPGEAITARAECFHLTRSVAFVKAEAMDGNSETPIATAAGTFMVGPAK